MTELRVCAFENWKVAIKIKSEFEVDPKYSSLKLLSLHGDMGSMTFRTRAGGSLWLWDGDEEYRLDRAFSSQEQKYPTRGLISAPLLVERIEKNYRAQPHEVW